MFYQLTTLPSSSSSNPRVSLPPLESEIVAKRPKMLVSPMPALAHGHVPLIAHQQHQPLHQLVGPPAMIAPTVAPAQAFEGVPIFLVPNSVASGTTHQSVSALAQLVLMQRAAAEMKVNWATQVGGYQTKIDTSKHHHIFVGDLSPEVDNKTLRDAFAPFGEVSDAKVIRDLQTLKSKGYGFVSFVSREDAEKAIEQMNGQWLGRKTIRTNWATRRPVAGRQVTYDEVFNQTGPSNTTVYVGGIGGNVGEEELRKVFGEYGAIVEVRVFKQQGYAFVKFDSKDAACQAIVKVGGTEVCGQSVKCSWGKAGQPDISGSQYGYGYGYGGAQANPAYWQYYQQYYSNPALMQQWQSYWQSQQGGGGGGGQYN